MESRGLQILLAGPSVKSQTCNQTPNELYFSDPNTSNMGAFALTPTTDIKSV